ncbi:DNA-processing protein DprA [Desulfonauticus submarinus]
MNREQELFAFLCLTSVKGIGPASIKKIISITHLASQAWKNIDKVLKNLTSKSIELSQSHKAKIQNLAEQKIQLIKKSNVKYIFLTDDIYPKLLKEISTPPPILFYQGDINLLSYSKIALVGSRKASTYGLKMAQEIASNLSANGICVVSGLALGIDAAAHKAALLHKGKTIAVLGCGVNINYPYQNSKLQKDIANNGLILSEYLPNTTPEPQNFPSRNRIISGLCSGVVVVEAPKKSGALITAKYALEYGREIFAVPGTTKMYSFEGCNRLIQEGAYLVQQTEDILETLSLQINFPQNKKENYTIEHLSENEKNIYYLLQNKNKLHIEDLSQSLNLSIAEISGLLIQMEIKGIIQRLAGMYFCLK